MLPLDDADAFSQRLQRQSVCDDLVQRFAPQHRVDVLIGELRPNDELHVRLPGNKRSEARRRTRQDTRVEIPDKSLVLLRSGQQRYVEPGERLLAC